MSRNVRVLLVAIGLLGLGATGYGIGKHGFTWMRAIEGLVAALLVFAPQWLKRQEDDASR